MSKKDIERNNRYISEKYDRMNLTFPKGRKALYQELARSRGKSLNSVINELLQEWYADYIPEVPEESGEHPESKED